MSNTKKRGGGGGKQIDYERKEFSSPGFMKSDKPKSVAFNGELSLVDLKRKFCMQR